VVIISNNINIAQKTIEIYRAKDVIEKCFYMIKNFLDMARIRSHSDRAMQGKNFIFFIYLIILSCIHKVMIDQKLYNTMTMEELLKTMNNHQIIFIKNDRILRPATALQKKIYSAFNLPIPE
jgi:transposase